MPIMCSRIWETSLNCYRSILTNCYGNGSELNWLSIYSGRLFWDSKLDQAGIEFVPVQSYKVCES